ncbi:PqqD family protein [Janibacter sp. G368]|uniref:PqqD family protein n=1 Tax=Janibacter sp. G368 TaxID=3420441 RepID=UPI003D08B327
MNIHVPDDIGWTLEEDESGTAVLYLAHLPNGPICVLQGTAATIWLAARDGVGDVVAEVADAYEMPQETVRADVERFIDELVGQGLIRRT